jgi:hypothetical protein
MTDYAKNFPCGGFLQFYLMFAFEPYKNPFHYDANGNTGFFEISEVSKRKLWLVENKYTTNKMKIKRDSKNQSMFSTQPFQKGVFHAILIYNGGAGLLRRLLLSLLR